MENLYLLFKSPSTFTEATLTSVAGTLKYFSTIRVCFKRYNNETDTSIQSLFCYYNYALTIDIIPYFNLHLYYQNPHSISSQVNPTVLVPEMATGGSIIHICVYLVISPVNYRHNDRPISNVSAVWTPNSNTRETKDVLSLEVAY